METKENLNEQAKEARRQYFREWRKKNRDKVRASSLRYWTKKAQLQEKEVKLNDDK